MKKKRVAERGQALVLIALLMTSLIAIVGLAVDGGYALAERRHAQNAADAAALAGALAKIGALDNGLPMSTANVNMNAAALARATTNGFDNDGAQNVVEVHSPPINGPYSTCGSVAFNCNEYVQVIITSRTSTYFGRVLGIRNISNQVEAVSLAKGPDKGPLYGGNAIVALKPSSANCDGDLSASGNSTINIAGGGMWINSNNPSCAFKMTSCAGGGLNITGGGINIVGGYDISGCNGSISGSINTGASQYPFPPAYVPPEPSSCAQAGTVSNDKIAGVSTITPGWYDKIPPTAASERAIVMQPGNYCVNQVLKVNTPTTTLKGTGVFIYIRSGGNFSLSGGTVQLSAPTSGDYQGYLIYVATNFTGTPPNCTINGGSNDIFIGAIYAPYCDVIVNGTADFDGFQSQIIGYSVYLGGGSLLNVTYDPNQNPMGRRPPRIGLMR